MLAQFGYRWVTECHLLPCLFCISFKRISCEIAWVAMHMSLTFCQYVYLPELYSHHGFSVVTQKFPVYGYYAPFLHRYKHLSSFYDFQIICGNLNISHFDHSKSASCSNQVFFQTIVCLRYRREHNRHRSL